jgi:hypothetical protein
MCKKIQRYKRKGGIQTGSKIIVIYFTFDFFMCIVPSIILVEYIFLYIFIIILLKLFVNNFLKDISDIKKSVKEDMDQEVADDQIG